MADGFGPTPLLGPGEIGASLGDPAHVRDGVVVGLELVTAAADDVEVTVGAHPRPGGRTATSSVAVTSVSSAAASPLTQIRQVGNTSANPDP